MSARRRVVMTGAGLVGAGVVGSAAALETCLASARRRPGPVSAEALSALINEHESRRLSRVSQLTLAAGRLAVRDAGVEGTAQLGLVVGTELGDLRSTIEFADGFLQRGPAGLSALLFPNTVMNTMASATAIALAARSISLTLNAPGLGGELAVRRAAAAVAAGRAEVVLAGGVDEAAPALAGVIAALGGRPEARGEGAAFLVLEPLERAAGRGARILGEILGAASAALPAGRPRARGEVSRTVSRALASAGLSADGIAWIYDGTGAAGPRAARERSRMEETFPPVRVPVASVDALFGEHAGLGVLRILAAAWTARTGLLPAVAPLDAPAASAARVVRPGPGLVHGVARGGTQVVLVIGPPPSADDPYNVHASETGHEPGTRS